MKANEIFFFAPVNEVDEKKVRDLVESIKANGWTGAPILVSVAHGTLITGSHRLAALRTLDADMDWDGDLDDLGDIAEDVDDIIDAWCEENDNTIDDIQFDNLSSVFAGTWVEEYKDEIEER